MGVKHLRTLQNLPSKWRTWAVMALLRVMWAIEISNCTSIRILWAGLARTSLKVMRSLKLWCLTLQTKMKMRVGLVRGRRSLMSTMQATLTRLLKSETQPIKILHRKMAAVTWVQVCSIASTRSIRGRLHQRRCSKRTIWIILTPIKSSAWRITRAETPWSWTSLSCWQMRPRWSLSKLKSLKCSSLGFQSTENRQ